jgi:phosphoribosyl 1,2-cyclic phosphate phosphodiesterase
MEVTFLGTGTSGGVPLIGCECEVCKSKDAKDNRLRTSIMIKHNGQIIVSDCGPDFRQQMLRENVKKLDAILMTHAHRDHTAGFDDIRAFNFISGKPIQVYCDYTTHLGIKDQYGYVFSETDYPYLPKMNFTIIENEPFSIGDLSILPINVLHGGMPVKSYRFGNFSFITDAKEIVPAEREKLRGTKVLIVNALREQEHYSHFTIQQSLQLVEEINPEHAYFIHMSHQFGLHEAVQAKLPSNITVAYDGLKINV